MRKWYIGKKGTFKELFSSDVIPTVETHGNKYNAVIGAFKTKRDAVYMLNNPYCHSVEDAERLRKHDEMINAFTKKSVELISF